MFPDRFRAGMMVIQLTRKVTLPTLAAYPKLMTERVTP